MDVKLRINNAILKYSRKNLREKKLVKRQSPEKLVEQQIMEWCAHNDFDVTVVDSARHHGERQKVGENGFPDLVGNVGPLSVWIELKSPDNKNNLSINQYNFLLRKISAGCFAVCVSSSDDLAYFWRSYRASEGDLEKLKFLKTVLPQNKKIKTELQRSQFSKLFDE